DAVAGDTEERAEQQAVDPVQIASVEGDEEEAGGQGEGLHDADQRRLAAAPGPTGPRGGADDEGPTHAEGEEPELGREPDEDGASGARKADEGEGVAGEGLTAKDHE